MSSYANLKRDLRRLADPLRAQILQKFFKTGLGQYGAGDIFLGIQVPIQRQIAKKYAQLKLSDLEKLLHSKIHEFRLVALLILVDQYACANVKDKEKIFRFYLKNTPFVNNWDLVDLTAPKIVGPHLLTANRQILYRLAKSKNLWQRRIAIITTAEFIRQHNFKDTLKLAKILLNDRHDLIHKAVGWMLREVGKRDLPTLLSFLNSYARVMPRTALRYSIEKLPKKKRKYYLNSTRL